MLRKINWCVADVALSQKLQEELKYEAEANEGAAETPEFLKAFREQGVWEVRSFFPRCRFWACLADEW